MLNNKQAFSNIRRRALLTLAADKTRIAMSQLSFAHALLTQGLQEQASSILRSTGQPLRQARRLLRTASTLGSLSENVAPRARSSSKELAA